MVTALAIKDELFACAIPGKREVLARFFKTGKGQYGEGDQFIGVTVPQQRALVKQFESMSPYNIETLLEDPFHECRMTALLFLVKSFQKSKSDAEKEGIFNFYINHTKGINNWDLVDLSAPQIVGAFLLNRNKELLTELATSDNLWERRIAMVSTLTFIRAGEFDETFRIADLLINDKEDLMHKAMGWMLREVGKKDLQKELAYLKKRYKKMPRTALRYAIERMDETTRSAFLKGEY